MLSLATHVELQPRSTVARRFVACSRPVAADRAASDRLIAVLHKGLALLLQVTRSESSDASTATECAAGGVGHASDRRTTMALTTRRAHHPPFGAHQREKVGRQLQAVRTAPSGACR